ncbi:methionyl-tRNA formyltransferase [Pseudomonadales bacterium]|nr:methionyl-tRNA formyltransferase [Pseudomonadales bacterium]
MMRVLFAGTPEFAVEHLNGLIAHPDISVVAVVTQPDRPGKRGKKLIASPVKHCALEAGLTVLQPTRLQAKHLTGFSFDLLIVVAYGQILKPEVLVLPRIGPINVHASLLPRWRGAAPVQRAILAGDQTTGVTIMKMAEGLDTGPIISVQPCNISSNETSDSLFKKLASLGREALLHAVETIAETGLVAKPQPESGVTYAHKILKAEAKIDWSMNSTLICQHIRAFVPDPVAFTNQGETRFRCYGAEVAPSQPDNATPTPAPGTIVERSKTGIRVQCGEGQLYITQLQSPTGKGTIVQGSNLKNLQTKLLDPGERFE